MKRRRWSHLNWSGNQQLLQWIHTATRGTSYSERVMARNGLRTLVEDLRQALAAAESAEGEREFREEETLW